MLWCFVLDEHRLSSPARKRECFQRNSLWIYARRTYLLKYFSVHIWLLCPFHFQIHEKICIISSHLPKPRASWPASDKQALFTSPKTLTAPRDCWCKGSLEELLQKEELSPWVLLQGRLLTVWEEQPCRLREGSPAWRNRLPSHGPLLQWTWAVLRDFPHKSLSMG